MDTVVVVGHFPGSVREGVHAGERSVGSPYLEPTSQFIIRVVVGEVGRRAIGCETGDVGPQRIPVLGSVHV